MRFSIINHPFLGVSLFSKHPYKAKPNFNGLPPSFMSKSCPQKESATSRLSLQTPSGKKDIQGHVQNPWARKRHPTMNLRFKSCWWNSAAETGITKKTRHHQTKQTKSEPILTHCFGKRNIIFPTTFKRDMFFLSSRKVRNVHFINLELFEPKVKRRELPSP